MIENKKIKKKLSFIYIFKHCQCTVKEKGMSIPTANKIKMYYLLDKGDTNKLSIINNLLLARNVLIFDLNGHLV